MSFSRRTRPNKSRGRRPAGQAVGVFLLFLLSFDSFFRSLLIVSRTAPFIHSSPMLFHAPEWGFALFSNSQARGRGPEPAGRGLSLLSPLALVLFPLLPPSLSHLLPLLVRARDMFLGFYRITITELGASSLSRLLYQWPKSAAVARVTIPVETPILPGKCGGCIASQATSELTGCGQKKAKGVV